MTFIRKPNLFAPRWIEKIPVKHLLMLFVWLIPFGGQGQPYKSPPARQPVFAQRSLDGYFGFGGGGTYDSSLKVLWWRDWDGSYDFPPGMNGRPPFKMWTVGKLDNRIDGPPSSKVVSREAIDAVFKFERTKIGDLIRAGYTGQYWEIANEPNYFPLYTPEDYAYEYHLFCNYIKSMDASARCVLGGLTMLKDNWHPWLDAFEQAYQQAYRTQPFIDVWGIHPYPFFDGREAQMTIDSIAAFRNARPSGPIWITEFGYPGFSDFSEETIMAYMQTVVPWLIEHHLGYDIERWFWWGVLAGKDGMGSNGLFASDPYNNQSMTPAGRLYFALKDQPYPANLLASIRKTGLDDCILYGRRAKLPGCQL